METAKPAGAFIVREPLGGNNNVPEIENDLSLDVFTFAVPNEREDGVTISEGSPDKAVEPEITTLASKMYFVGVVEVALYHGQILR